jgi:hypothetical protein
MKHGTPGRAKGARNKPPSAPSRIGRQARNAAGGKAHRPDGNGGHGKPYAEQGQTGDGGRPSRPASRGTFLCFETAPAQGRSRPGKRIEFSIGWRRDDFSQKPARTHSDLVERLSRDVCGPAPIGPPGRAGGSGKPASRIAHLRAAGYAVVAEGQPATGFAGATVSAAGYRACSATRRWTRSSSRQRLRLIKGPAVSTSRRCGRTKIHGGPDDDALFADPATLGARDVHGHVTPWDGRWRP